MACIPWESPEEEDIRDTNGNSSLHALRERQEEDIRDANGNSCLGTLREPWTRRLLRNSGLHEGPYFQRCWLLQQEKGVHWALTMPQPKHAFSLAARLRPLLPRHVLALAACVKYQFPLLLSLSPPPPPTSHLPPPSVLCKRFGWAQWWCCVCP